MYSTTPRPPMARPILLALAVGLAATLLGVTTLGCHSGTPAAPEGTEIFVDCEFITRDVTTGNFEALIKARVADEESDVPQVGVGVYFRISGGPGEMTNQGPIRTNNEGRAQSILIGAGATDGNDVTVEVSSGAVTADITMDVLGCFSQRFVPPVLDFSVTPTGTVRVTQQVEVDLSDSTDADCAGGKPVRWRIEWGDGQTSNDDFADEDKPTHDYADDFPPVTPGTRAVTIRIEITDCQGLTDEDTYDFTLQR